MPTQNWPVNRAELWLATAAIEGLCARQTPAPNGVAVRGVGANGDIGFVRFEGKLVLVA